MATTAFDRHIMRVRPEGLDGAFGAAIRAHGSGRSGTAPREGDR